ncbi:DNA pilot protein [Flyfo microvirus Tbat2_130]|nr:DNA pilot protein [Flyfo microvirus Tbat2_130]
MDWIGPAISAAGSLFGGSNANSASAAIADNNNRFQENMWYLSSAWNAQEAEKARTFNHNEADLQRDWQTEMSNSSYQRAVTDLKKAGLNPMLAYTQGGAGTPSGATASGPMASAAQTPQAQRAEYRDAITPAITTALQAAQAKENVELLKAQKEKVEAEAFATRAQGWHLASQSPKTEAEIRELNSRAEVNQWSAKSAEVTLENTKATFHEIMNRVALLGEQVEHEGLKKDLTKSQKMLNEANELFRRQAITQQQFEYKIKEAAAQIIQHQIPLARNIGEVNEGKWGQAMAYLRSIPLGEVLNVLNAIGKASN